MCSLLFQLVSLNFEADHTCVIIEQSLLLFFFLLSSEIKAPSLFDSGVLCGVLLCLEFQSMRRKCPKSSRFGSYCCGCKHWLLSNAKVSPRNYINFFFIYFDLISTLWFKFILTGYCPIDCTLDQFLKGPSYNSYFDTTGLEARYEGGRQVRVPCIVGFTGFFRLICTEGNWKPVGSQCERTLLYRITFL